MKNKEVKKRIRSGSHCYATQSCPYNEVEARIRELPVFTLELLDKLIEYRSRHKMVYPSQQTLADELGVTTRTIQSHLDKLTKAGLVGKWYRHMQSSYYNIHEYFTRHERFNVKDVLPSIRLIKFSLVFLISLIGSAASAQVYGVLYSRFIQHNLNIINNNTDEAKQAVYEVQQQAAQAVSQSDIEQLEAASVGHELLDLPQVANRPTAERGARQATSEPSDRIAITTSLFKKAAHSRLDSAACNEARVVKSKGEVMKAIPSYIHDIKSINLTDLGKAQLSPFPEEIIRYADKKLQTAAASIKDPFRYFIGLCRRLCKDKQIQPVWAHVTQIVMENNIDFKDAYLKDFTINRKVNTGSTNSNRYKPFKPSSDPYSRSPEQIARFEAARAQRETMDPDKRARIELAAQQLRKAIGLKEDGTWTDADTTAQNEQASTGGNDAQKMSNLFDALGKLTL